MHISDFDYRLPRELIAQRPLAQRDASRLLVLDREDGSVEHRRFSDLSDFLRPGDVLVVNDSRVLRGRLQARKLASGGKVELLLLEQIDDLRWLALAGGRKVISGVTFAIQDRYDQETNVHAVVEAARSGAQRVLRFSSPIAPLLEQLGQVPLPPYIVEELEDGERYQTVFARVDGSAAAPTAGLHFSADLLLSLREIGVLLETVTLHVGLDTFKPLEVDAPQHHSIHSEWARLTPASARRINEARLAGGSIVAIGTTVVRVLESAALRSAGLNGTLTDISQRDASGETSSICPWKPVTAFEGRTDLFIYPGYVFRAVDMLVTNFHLPRSSLLLLVSALVGRDQLLSAYQEAIRCRYRFYSFGDAMLIL